MLKHNLRPAPAPSTCPIPPVPPSASTWERRSPSWPIWTSSGQPVTLVNAEGDRITPSVVLFDGQDVVVGKEAMKAMVTEGDHVAECVKRDMGHRVFHKVLEGKQYPPEVIEAWILNKLRVDAAGRSGRSARW